MTEKILCAIYCRYSSEQQRSSFSIEAQRRACEEYAKKHGWQIYKFYVDEARSGTSDKREAFQRMISESMAAAIPFQIVLVYKSDRFARNREDAVKYKAILKRQKIRFVSATEPIGTGDVTDVLLESVMDGINELYSLQLSQRTLAGMAEAVRQGRPCGRPPYGYKHVSIETDKGPKKKVVVDSAQARVVRRIFALYLKGDGVQAIRHKLYKKGYKFTNNFLLRMIRNEKYAGDTSFGRHPHKNSKTTIEPITIKNSHEPIVDRKTWEAAQNILEGKTKRDTRIIPSDYLLSGLLKCACGASMVGHAAHGNGGRFRYYSCCTRLRKGNKECLQKSINANHLEDTIFSSIQEYLTDEENILGLVQANNDALTHLKINRSKDLGRLKTDIARKDSASKNLMRAIESGEGLNFGHVAARLEEISREKGELEAQVQDLESFQLLKPIDTDETKVFLKHLQAIFSSGLIRNKTLFHGLVRTIELIPDGRSAKVTYNPNFHPQAEMIGLKKSTAASAVRMKEIWGGRCHIMRTFWREQIIHFDFKTKKNSGQG